MRMDRKLGMREFTALIVVTIGSKLTDMTSTILFKEAGHSAWMVPIVSGVFMLIPLLVLIKLVKAFETKGLIEIIYTLTGKYIGFILSISLFFIAYSSTVLNTRGYVDILNSLYFPNSLTIQLYIILMVAIFFVSKRGFLNIGYTAWISVPYITVSFIILILLIWRELHISYIFPLGGYGIGSLVKTSVNYSSIVGDIFFFSVLYPYFRNYRTFRNASILGYSIVIFQLMVFFVVYLMTYDFPIIDNVLYPFHEITRMVQVGRVLSNVEAIFLAFWSVASILRFAVYLYISVAIFSYSLKIKEFEPLLLPFAALTIMLGVIPDNAVENVLVYRSQYVLNTSWIYLVCLPILLWGLAKWKGVVAK
ncbi:GerAB/ArcD/ProY family transporter [Metabacillus sp. HB246100]